MDFSHHGEVVFQSLDGKTAIVVNNAWYRVVRRAFGGAIAKPTRSFNSALKMFDIKRQQPVR